jgi:hypothetical protein
VELLTAASLPYIQAQAFLSEAKAGHLWVPDDISGPRADVLAAVVRSAGPSPLAVHISTTNGGPQTWTLAQELDAHPDTTAHVGHYAKSAGLILVVSCRHRVCQSYSRFLYHGSPYKRGGGDDDAKAQWLAKHTAAGFTYWRDLATPGEDFEFGAEEALELGVVHEIAT